MIRKRRQISESRSTMCFCCTRSAGVGKTLNYYSVEGRSAVAKANDEKYGVKFHD